MFETTTYKSLFDHPNSRSRLEPVHCLHLHSTKSSIAVAPVSDRSDGGKLAGGGVGCFIDHGNP